jgi:hypothetical protein
MTKLEAWMAVADRLYEKGKAIFDHSGILKSREGTRDPKVVALALLARTMNNFQAAIFLLENGYVVEARALVRCCWENLFWISNLRASPEKFIAAMELDDVANRIKRAAGLSEWAKTQKQEFNFSESLEEFRKSLKEKHPDANPIQHKNAADIGGIADAYIFYRELSTDASHPSAVSLSRHITWSDDQSEFTVHGIPISDTEEQVETVDLGCTALIGVNAAAQEIIGGAEIGEKMEALYADLRVLILRRE